MKTPTMVESLAHGVNLTAQIFYFYFLVFLSSFCQRTPASVPRFPCGQRRLHKSSGRWVVINYVPDGIFDGTGKLNRWAGELRESFDFGQSFK